MDIPFCCFLKGTGFLFLFSFSFLFLLFLTSPLLPLFSFTIGFYSFLNKFAISDYLGERRDTKEEKGGGKRREKSVAEHLLSFSPLLLVKQLSFGAVQLKMFSPYPCHLHLKGFFFFSLFFLLPFSFLFLSYFPHLSSSFFVFFEKQKIQE